MIPLVSVDSHFLICPALAEAFAHVRALALPGASILELATAGDDLITAECKKIFTSSKMRGRPRGLAFPTCVSLNNLVGHVSPMPGNTTTLQQGDLVKMFCPVIFVSHFS